MKKLLSFAVLILIANLSSHATDLIVEEFGSSPTYSSIGAAVTAAVDGDRIIIKNRTGSIPWVENLTITKTLDILPYVHDSFFIIQGQITFSPATAKTLNIIGMYNASGGVNIANAITGTRGILRILGCNLVNGSINADYDNYDLTLYGTKMSNGYVTYRHGSILGNDITYNNSFVITVNSESTVSNDTSYIMGNRITCTYGSGYALYWTSNSMNLDIRNNFITTPQYGMYVTATRATNSTLNKIYNNTVSFVSSSYTGYGIYVTSSPNTVVEVMNNLIDKAGGSQSTYGVSGSQGSNSQINCYYNYFDNALSAGTSGTFTVNQNNITGATTVNATTGVTLQGVDQGNPSTIFYDLDLTRNDCGAYGGSFSQNNYFPQFTGSARVFLTSFLFNIRTGNTLSVKATSFDR